MNILLTGAKGNFGQEFIRKSDCGVVQLNRGEWGELDIKLAGEIEAVIHAACDLRSPASSSPMDLVDSNLVSTARLLESVKRNKVPRFIFLSSCAVYGEDMRTYEENVCCPVSINGISKLLNERLIEEFCSANGIKYEVLRIFNMYGGQDSFSILSHLERSLTAGTPFTLNNMGLAQRDFIHVSDVATIVARLLETDVPYTHLNIGTGVAIKVSTLVEHVLKRFPDLSINYAQAKEAEYSRADISKLNKLMAVDFIKIEEYIETDFMNSVA